MSTHEELQRSLGSYMLGALDAGERAAVEAHLPGCPACTRELASYAGLPALLSRVPLEQAVAGPPEPPTSVLPGLLAAVQRAQRHRDRRLRRWQTAAGALAAAAALAVGVTVTPQVLDRDGDQRQLTTAAPTAAGTVELDARPWGTAVRLRLEGLPDRGPYTAWATDAAGTRSAVATWSGTASGQVDVSGATSLPLDAVRRISVSDGQDAPVLTFGG